MLIICILLTLAEVISVCCLNCDSFSDVCLSCSTNYYLYNSLICLPSCPEGYSISGSNCILSSSTTLINEDFSLYTSWTVSSIGNFHTGAGQLLSSNDKSAPIPTKYQGLYLVPSSYLKSSITWVPAPDLTLVVWVLSKADGHIFETRVLVPTKIRLSISSSVYSFLITTIQQSTGTYVVQSEAIITSTTNWEQIKVKIKQNTATSLNMVAYLNTIQVFSKTIADLEGRYESPMYWAIGCPNGFSFSGFIYSILVSNSDYSGDLTDPSHLVTCSAEQYWDGTACNACDASCSTWPWCISGTTCSLCSSASCASCTGYSASDCFCSNSEVYPNCCHTGCSSCSTFWSCSSCSVSFNLIDSLCLSYCPTGSCSSLSPSKQVNADLSKFSKTFSGFTTGLNEETFFFFNNGEADDPVPASGRGLYFEPGRYLTHQSLSLAHFFSIGIWTLPISGTVYSKSNEIILDSSSLVTIKLTSKSDTTQFYQSLTSTLTGWTYVTVSVRFSVDTTYVKIGKDLVEFSSIAYLDKVFKDWNLDGLAVGGSFYGFVYWVSVWNYAVDDFAEDFDDLPCGVALGVTCLNECGFGMFEEGACLSCDGGCEFGCVEAGRCSPCKDGLCGVCESFSSGCSDCISHASGTPCQCDTGYFQDNFQCTECHARCSSCYNSKSSTCTSCKSSFFLFNSHACLLLTPTGYSTDSLSQTPISSKFEGVNLGEIDQIQIGSSSQNIYPQYEQTDAIPAKLRGYYFNQNSLIKFSVILAPTFMIRIWVKASNSGRFLYKSSIFDLFIAESSKLTLISSNGLSVDFDFNMKTWEFLEIINDYDNLQIKINQAIVQTASLPESFEDISTEKFYIGKDSDFIGFVYFIEIWNLISSSSTLYSEPTCPNSTFCLSNCEIDQDPAESCESCPEHCINGCYESKCTQCPNDLCSSCPDINSCKSCIENAEFSLNFLCYCKTNFYYSNSTFKCEPCEDSCNQCNSSGCFNCKDGFFLQNSKCSQCPEHCETCDSECKTCIQNAFLYEGLCYCLEGFNGAQCSIAWFNASLSLYGDKLILLYFDEDLRSQLKSSSLEVVIKNKSVDFILKQESSRKFLIDSNIQSSANDQSIKVKVLKELVSVNNSLLVQKEFEIVIKAENGNQDAQTLSTFESAYSSLSTYATTAAVAVSMMNPNPASLWSFINTIQLLCFASLTAVDPTPRVSGMLVGLRSYFLFPNAIKYFYSSSSEHSYPKAVKLGFATNSFLINIGKPLTAFCSFLVLYLFIFLISNINFHCNALNEFILEMKLEFKFGFFIRFSIQCYLDISVAGMISILTFDSSDVVNILNLLFACVFQVITNQAILLLIPFFSAYISRKNRFKEVDKDKLKSLYGTLFYEFNSDENLSTSLYYTFFFARRFIYSLVLFLLLDYPIIQMTLCIILSLAVMHI